MSKLALSGLFACLGNLTLREFVGRLNQWRSELIIDVLEKPWLANAVLSWLCCARGSDDIYVFLFEMERKHSFSSTNRYWCERKLHFKILYLFSSVLFCFKNFSNGQGMEH